MQQNVISKAVYCVFTAVIGQTGGIHLQKSMQSVAYSVDFSCTKEAQEEFHIQHSL